MFKKLLSLSFVILFSIACKKDVKQISYGNLDMTAIKSQEANFKDIPIEALDANSAPVLHKGAVVIFKTNNGNYGKL